jgi:hypothetical protein
MKWIYADRIEVALDANGNPTEIITEEDREKQRMLREGNEAQLLVYKEQDEVYEQTLEEICEEYGFDIKNIQTQRDETPTEVQFYGIKKTMPRWKAVEFTRKLNKLGFTPMLDGICMPHA